MASTESVVQQLMDEFGKSSAVVRTRVTNVLGDITIDILSNNDGRFRKLREVKDFDIKLTDKSYKVPGNFNTATKHFHEIDSDGDVVREIEIVSEARYFERQTDPDYTGSIYAYIEVKKTGSDGPGEYLTLNKLPGKVGTYRLPYYRIPVAGDTDIIRNVRAVKEGVRSHFPEFYPLAQQSLVIYEKMKSGIMESPETRTTAMTMKPSKKDQNRNRRMYNIGHEDR